MRVDLLFTPHQMDEMALRGKSVVVIDVLRASTTIVTALHHGAKEIIPVTTVESAVKISGNLFGDVILLGGERNGRMIEGFNLGNSPREYSEEKVRGKSIIFNSTNGSQALVRARYARDMVVCGFINISTVSGFIREQRRDIIILCAGTGGMFSLEDAACAGMLISKLGEKNSLELVLSDAAQAAAALYRLLGKGILKMIKSSEHGRFLAEIGFADDLPVCAGVDTIPVLPQLMGSVLKIKRDVDRKEEAKVSVSS